MAEIEVLLPKMGESVAEATITSWLKNEGDTIALDEPIVEIATDKVDSEVPSPNEGVLVKRLCNEGDVVAVGSVIAIISTGGAAASTPSKPTETTAPAPVAAKVEEQVMAPLATASNGHVELPKNSELSKFYSPLVRSIAQTEGVTLQELETISGTGKDGRVTKQDILNYIPNRGKQTAPAPAASTTTTAAPAAKPAAAPSPEANSFVIKQPTVVAGPNDEIIEMDRMRKLIADNMVMSKHVSPHVTSYVEADVTNIVMWREKVKSSFEKTQGEKITFTPIFMEAIVKAIKDFPNINISVSGTNIIKRKNINVGMATALPSGNLIVPVIKNADQLNLVGITKQVNDLANRARNNKLSPDDIQGGTFTVTNVGTFGNVMGTPIILQPQVAILALGAIRKVPAVIETPTGDVIAIRHKMFLSHSYDHRVVDGALGGSFVKRVADYLEQFDLNREI
jgi:2-oxoglutarate dehydrogenase E2 component (dihydrolipoamide succinyltransferase)